MINRKLIQKKDWNYYIYEVECDYELLVPIPNPAPGFDVKYILSQEEKNNFIASGVVALEDRINDMRKNYVDYTLAPWR